MSWRDGQALRGDCGIRLREREQILEHLRRVGSYRSRHPRWLVADATRRVPPPFDDHLADVPTLAKH